MATVPNINGNTYSFTSIKLMINNTPLQLTGIKDLKYSAVKSPHPLKILNSPNGFCLDTAFPSQ